MKFKVGDRVRVRKGLVIGHRYGKNTFVSEMEKYEGKIITIKEVGKNYYDAEGTKGWSWTDEMLEPEPVKKEKEMKFKVGDKVRIRDDLKVDRLYDGFHFIQSMEKYKGKIYEIERILQNVQCYRLKDISYSWTDKMLEPVEEGKKMRFKIGDKVRVRKCLIVGYDYGGNTFTGPMKKYEGKIITIKKVGEDYYIAEETEGCNWSDEMLEPVKEKMKFRVGDKVRVRKGLVAGHHYNGILFTESMKKYEGEILTIESVQKDWYLVKGDLWSWTDEMLEPVKDKKEKEEYRIIVEGRKVTAENEKGDVGIARCNPKDEFDLSTGINLAIERLLEWPKNGDQYYTVCMDNGTGLMEASGPYSFAQLPCACRYRKNKNMFKTREEAEEMAAKINELFAARDI